ncbi:TBC1 domain family member 12 [Lampris incognitus]|uniref:TBC1 domain family member 12 n=1 Tax=Lampris incognitus TaxID=2546036 RepID=UPI0024B5E2D3|nr:TBC1 domain family member 12 [Lampris incognitus]
METTDDGSSHTATGDDEGRRDGAPGRRLSAGQGERRASPAGDTDRRQTSRAEPFPVESNGHPPRKHAGVRSDAMLDAVADGSSPPPASARFRPGSDGIRAGPCGNGPGGAARSDCSGSPVGQTRPCCPAGGETGSDERSSVRPGPSSVSQLSATDRKHVKSITVCDENSSKDAVGDVNCQSPAPVRDETGHHNGRHLCQGASSEGLTIENGDWLSKLLVGSDVGVVAPGMDATCVNGGLQVEEDCSTGDLTAAHCEGRKIICCPLNPHADMDSSATAVHEGQASRHGDTPEDTRAANQQSTGLQPVASSFLQPSSHGTVNQVPLGVNPNANPTLAVGLQKVDGEGEEEGEAAAGPGLCCRGALGPRSLPCSMSYDLAPVSPGSRLEAGPDDAFAEPQTSHWLSEQRFVDVRLGSRNTYESSRRQSAPGQLPQGGGFSTGEMVDPALQSRRPGIAEYLGRGLFSRKHRTVSQSAPGWKLFGKVPLRESPTKDSKAIQQEYEARQSRSAASSSPTQHAAGRSRKNLEFEPLSTTALILEDRPANLPAKSVEEAQRHRQQYDEMVAEAKKRELKEAQRKQRQMKERFKQEESIANAMVVWNTEILPHWDTMKSSRRARELWWQGLPPNVRGRVWSLAIGNELNITPELYGIFLSRAKEKWRSFSETGPEDEADDGASLADRESSLELIKLDISRTFPSLYIFQKGGPYHDLLHSILGAYTCYRPDVGYVQGMSFIAAVLILNMEEADAFISFANLLNKPCQMAFFRVDHELMLKYFGAFEVFFEENLPRLYGHFQSSNLTPDLYLIDWIFSLYTKPLPLDVACRVWDVFCRDGEEFLFRAGLGILRLYQDVLLQMDFIHIAQFLARLPDEELLSDRLFSCIAATPMLSGNRKWTQVFSSLMKDTKETEKNANMAQRS